MLKKENIMLGSQLIVLNVINEVNLQLHDFWHQQIPSATDFCPGFVLPVPADCWLIIVPLK